MVEEITREQAQELLQKLLQGDFVYRVSMSDAIEMCFNHSQLSLIGQAVVSGLDGHLQQLLSEHLPVLLDKTDGQDAVRGALLAAVLRREVLSVEISETSALKFTFAGAVVLEFTADTAIVDWQWSLGPMPQRPYSTPYVIACFFQGQYLAGSAATHRTGETGDSERRR